MDVFQYLLSCLIGMIIFPAVENIKFHVYEHVPSLSYVLVLILAAATSCVLGFLLFPTMTIQEMITAALLQAVTAIGAKTGHKTYQQWKDTGSILPVPAPTPKNDVNISK
jgi:hypothetical protein